MSYRILIVEDSATQAEALRHLLEQERNAVTVARSAEDALEQVENGEFDLVLSDVVMGGMTGYDLCRQLKQGPDARELPVVLLTSLTDPMDIVRGLECGADNYITKPYEADHLLARVRHVLDNRRLRRNAKTSLGVSVRFMGRELAITSDREQILDLFISTVEDVVRTNEVLQRRERELAEAHARLETFAREKAVEARVSGERYRALLQNAGDAVLVLDMEGTILEANRRAADFLGRSAEALVGHTLADYFERESGSALTFLTRLPTELHVHLGQQRFVDVEGKEAWCEFTASLTPVGDESLVLLIGQDVTQRRKAETALHETNQLLAALVNAAPLGIFATDLDLNVRLWNPAAEGIFGFQEAEVLGKPIPIVPSDRERECAAVRRRVLTTGTVTGLEMQRLRKDGTLVDVSVSVAALRDATGDAEGFIGLCADITGKKHAELAVREREAAEQANRAKSEFLSRMSHELRTPLNAILGFGQLLEMDGLTPDQQESVEQILKGGHHLLGLINEVLDLSRIEAGKLSLSLEAVSVEDVLRGTVALIRPLAASRGITIEEDEVENEGAFVRADPQRLKQVILNLLSNAVKYNRAGGSVRVAVRSDGTGRVRIGVQDTGEGLAPERQRRLFVPFERLDADTSGISGTGLGLALAKGLTEAMDGTIGLESAEGEGSTFWIELDAAEDPPRDAVVAAAAPTPASSAAAADAGPARTVLYIEDNPSNLRLVERVLAGSPGIRLLTAMQGSLGLELAQQHRPDLILLDVNLPDVSGEEILRRVREHPVLKHTPVVMVSADAMPSQVDRYLRAGATEYLTKPIDVQRLLRVVDEGVSGIGS